MFEDPNHPFPNRVELRNLITKAMAEAPYSSGEYQQILNILVTLKNDAAYGLTMRLRDRAKDEG